MKALYHPGVLVGFEEAVQMADAGRVAHLTERLRLDLADALAGDAELAAHFFQRARVTIDQAEALFEDGALTLGERVEHVADLFLQERIGGHLGGILRRLVLDEIAERRVVAITDLR